MTLRIPRTIIDVAFKLRAFILAAVLCAVRLPSIAATIVQNEGTEPPVSAKAGRLYLLSVRCLGEADDLVTATEGFLACIKADPTFGPAYLQLSDIYDRQHNWDASIRILTDLLVVEKNGNIRHRVEERIAALNRIKSTGTPPPPGAQRAAEFQRRFAAGDISGALAKTFGPGGADDKDPLAYIVAASLALTLGSPSKALPLLDEALKRIPDGAQADVKSMRDKVAADIRFEHLRDEASAEMRRGDYTDAFDALHQVVRSPLVDRNVIESFAFSADAVRQYGPAAATLEQCATVLDSPLSEVARDQALRLKNRASLHAKAKRYAEIGRRVLSASAEYSARNYLEALKLDPSNVDYLMGFAAACRKEKKPGVALDAVRQAIAEGGYSTTLADGVSILSAGGAQDESDRLSARLSADAGRRGASAQLELAEAFIAAKQNGAAAAVLDKIPADAPNRGLVSRMRAQCLFADKNYPGAEAAFRKAIDVDPENGANYADLAGSLLRSGHKDEARRSAVEAIKRGVKDHWVFKELLGGK
jgi:tetratricopeptide (TPR) repeat protein